VLNLILIIVCGSLVVALLIKDLKFSKYVAKSVRSNASRANKMLHQLAEDRSWSAYYAPPALIDATTDQVQVIYAVVTVAEKAEMRNAIRTSYRQMISADPVKYHNDIVKVVFVVGKPDHDGFSAHVRGSGLPSYRLSHSLARTTQIRIGAVRGRRCARHDREHERRQDL
jgi:hypothetical protein